VGDLRAEGIDDVRVCDPERCFELIELLASAICEVMPDHPSVILLPFPSDPSSFLEATGQAGHIRGAQQ
jgi:hypothetical protein